jgi:hypothetical protein
MKRLKFNQDLLNQYLTRDNSFLVGKYEKLTGEANINFICNCGKEYSKNFKNIVYKSGVFCKECSVKNKKEKFKQTNIEKYGVEHPFKNEEIRNKCKETLLKNYGVEYPLQSKEIKNKTKEVYLEKYGTEHSSQNEEVKKKVKQTNLEKYGTEAPFQNDKIKEKIRNIIIDKFGVENVFQNEEIKQKIKETNLQKYGTENSMQNEEVKNKAKQTCLEKFGFENAMQSKEIQAKMQEKGKKYKTYKFPSGEIRNIQGYEPFALDILLKDFKEEDIKTDRIDVPTIIYKFEDKTRIYFPDIFIPSINKIIEVKSNWTYECNKEINNIKSKTSKEKGYIFEFWIFDEKGKLKIM